MSSAPSPSVNAISAKAADDPSFTERLQNYMDVPIVWWLAFTTFLQTLASTAFRNPIDLLNITNILDVSFGKTWLKMTTTQRDLEGHPLSAQVPLLASASGVVLEIGPGGGDQLRYLDPSKITRIYGVEPCVLLHDKLRANVKRYGFEGKYFILGVSAERNEMLAALQQESELAVKGAHGMAVFDTIICSKVLCSLPARTIHSTASTLYDLLAPAGRLLVVEHVVNPCWTSKGSFIGRGLQVLFTGLGWTYLMGGCCLGRDTGKVLRNAAKKDGGWESVNLQEILSWSALPHVLGTLRKRA